jgi:5-deoxy-glucuronate isomerase
LLLQGKARVTWQQQTETLSRKTCFTDNPACLLIPSQEHASIECLADATRFAVMVTPNEKRFTPIYFKAENCKSENRGAGTLNECATRVVRTLLNREICPQSNFLIGEVINYPGKWSSFPPHSHVHPEIYYYNFLPSQHAYGFSQDGDEVYVVQEGDALLALDGRIHPQVAAPGYAMFYVWVIRNSDSNPHIAPPPVKEHAWTTQPGAKYYPESLQ